jgi:pectate lyase
MRLVALVAPAVTLLVGCGRGDDLSLGGGEADAAACAEDAAVPADLVASLGAAIGFGRGATGGMDGCVAHVTSLADSGAGTLRDVAERPEPSWIVFDVSGVIQLASTIRVASNKTLDGRGQSITVSGYGLMLSGVTNVVLENLALGGDGASGSGSGDAISLEAAASDVWIDHCTLSAMSDDLIDISHASTNVTVSWCKFSNQDFVLLAGSDAADVEDVALRVTVHHSWFDQTGNYHPRVRFGKVHALNNLVDRWTAGGMQVSMGGELRSEGNIFVSGPKTLGLEPQGGTDPDPGRAASVGDLLLSGATVTEGEPTLVFDPQADYPYVADVADDALQTRLVTETGAR